jgi:hypothetical protein
VVDTWTTRLTAVKEDQPSEVYMDHLGFWSWPTMPYRNRLQSSFTSLNPKIVSGSHTFAVTRAGKACSEVSSFCGDFCVVCAPASSLCNHCSMCFHTVQSFQGRSCGVISVTD